MEVSEPVVNGCLDCQVKGKMEEEGLEVLEELCGNLRLMKEKLAGIELDDGSSEVAREKGYRSLIGRIYMERVIGREVLAVMMTKIWRISTLVEFQEVGNNTFILA